MVFLKNHRVIVFRTVLTVLTVLMIIFIFSNSSFNADISSKHSTSVLEIVNNLFDEFEINIDFTETFVRKSAHFVEYFVLGVLLSFNIYVFLLKPCVKLLFVPLIGLAVSCVDETIQLFSSGRSCQISDILLDFFAVCTAFIISFVIINLINISDKNKEVEK